MLKLNSNRMVWAVVLVMAGSLMMTVQLEAAVKGWLSWRGPQQNGTSLETGLPDKLGSKEDALWVADFPGMSTPVIAGGRLYVMGYLGEGADLQEGIGCFDAETGELLWKRGYNDYLSDTIYLRYATSSPTIDAETGNIYMQGTQGILAAFTPAGESLWSHSLMEKLGRLTFPNGRTATPVVEGDLVVTRGITSNWGDQGAGGDRFYAFDKRTGELVWASSPGDRPRDNSFSHPQLGWFMGERVFYAATGDGSVVCVNVRTGEPIWRVPLFKAGINATVVVHNDDKVIAIFGTPYEPGEMVAIRLPAELPAGNPRPVVIERPEVQLWANPMTSSTSSPILAGDRVYLVLEKGDLCSVDANTGEVYWRLQLGIEQRNSCPLYADGKLYVPMLDNPAGKGQGSAEDAGSKGAFYIIRPTDRAGEILTHIELDGRCFGSPSAYNGKVYVQTTSKLYCFGRQGNNPGVAPEPAPVKYPAPGPATRLQIVPYEVILHAGESASFRARKLDARGFVVEEVADVRSLKWEPYIPPTALVKVRMDAAFDAEGRLVAGPGAQPSAGRYEARLGGLKGYIRGRVIQDPPIEEDFESFVLSQTTTNSVEPPTSYAYPPLPWIGARFRFEVREQDGSKVLAKTIDNKFFQRGSVFIGDPAMKSYTVEADVMSEGTRRKMSEVGLVNQRYIIVLKGNAQEIEVNSNLERLKVAVPFRWSPNQWYRLKTRVDVAPDGTGMVRGKAWKRGDPEPEAWTIEVPHQTAHRSGSPGIFAFSPQDQQVFIDNVRVTPN
ncbi:MAG: PQQ-binding-like beta-propeller repeat protein [Verrucomicrobia bacterium]|nr:PQQ-binding-like beta-propeller repeat protein [Verrucomicrobiota bacterium]